jgi:predicted  nucleic acid-binding Zn-ribbon protein
MRKPNIELNRIKLAQKKIQLSQIENQLSELQSKIEAVTERLNNKQLEVSQLETFLNDTVSPAVSE